MQVIRKTVLFLTFFYCNIFFKWVKIWSNDETPIYKKNPVYKPDPTTGSYPRLDKPIKLQDKQRYFTPVDY
jgi:hypothetical protein